MPLPKPMENQEEEDFLTSCMSNEVMIEEFPKLEQRFAVCKIQWDSYEEENEEESEDEEDDDDELEQLQTILEKLRKATNFPERGDDETVSLQNSKYQLFPIAFAEKIKTQYPEVWGLGGNILGNEQYKHLYTIRTESISNEDLTPRQVEAIRLREAWSARHEDDFRPAGVMAQIKWHMVGSRGLKYMQDLMNEEIDKRYGGNN